MVTTSLGGNGHGGTAVLEPTAPAYLEQDARDHVWIHQATWVELARTTGSSSSTAARAHASTTCTAASTSTASPVSGSSTPVTAGARSPRRWPSRPARLAYASVDDLHHRRRRCSWPRCSPSSRPAISTASSSAPAARRRSRRAIKIAKQVQAMRGFPQALQDHRPPRLLPRHDLRRDEPDRDRATRPTSARSCTASPTCRTRTATAPTSASRASRPTSWPPATSSRRSRTRDRRRSPR